MILKENSINLPIQYLRGIAAVLVVFAHFSPFPTISMLHGANLHGAIGVDIFFIISGLIMSFTVEKYKARKLEFVTNRIIRIYPLYILLTISVIFIGLNDINLISIIKSLFFIGGTFRTYKDPILFSGWTLFYEFVFYIIIITFANFKRLVNIILFSMGLIGVMFHITAAYGLIFNSFFLYFLIGYNLSPVLKSFNPQSTGLHFILSAAILLIVILFGDQFGDRYPPRQFVDLRIIEIPRIFFWGIPSLYFIVSFITYTAKYREIVILKYLGDRSYSIYLVHSVLRMFALSTLVHEYLSFIPDRVYSRLFFLLIIPISHITYNLVEVRFTRWIKTLLTPAVPNAVQTVNTNKVY